MIALGKATKERIKEEQMRKSYLAYIYDLIKWCICACCRRGALVACFEDMHLILLMDFRYCERNNEIRNFNI